MQEGTDRLKTCNRCNESKPESEYYTKTRKRPNGTVRVYVENPCKSCLLDSKRKVRICLACGDEWQHFGSSGTRSRFCTNCAGKWRACSQCAAVLGEGEFYESNPLCKPCSREYNRSYLYGLAPGAYDSMYAAQGGACAICGDSSSKLVVDHDHDTGDIRGLLCGLCNSGLGYFKDNVSSLMGAIKYLDAGRD